MRKFLHVLLSACYTSMFTFQNSPKDTVGLEIQKVLHYISLKLDDHLSNDLVESKTSTKIDLTLPESYQSFGSIHPITLIIDEIM